MGLKIPGIDLLSNRKKKKEETTTQGSSKSGRAIVLRNNPTADANVQNELKKYGYSDAAIQRLADKDNREAFESDMQTYKNASRTETKATKQKYNHNGTTVKQHKAKVQAEKDADLLNTKKAIASKYGITEDEFDTAYDTYKDSKQSKNKSIDTWLSPDYKMSKEDRAESKKITSDYFKNNKKAKALYNARNANETAAIMASMTPEDKEEYARMTSLENKTSALTSAYTGFMSAVPTYNRNYDKISKTVNENMGLKGDYSYSTAVENSGKQNKAAQIGGRLAGTAAMYGVANKVIPNAPILGKMTSATGKALASVPGLGKLGQTALTGFSNDMAADVLLDTLPEYYENRKNGMSSKDARKEAYKNLGVNAAFNLLPTVADSIMNKNTVVDSLIKENPHYNSKVAELIKNNPVDEADDVVENVVKQSIPEVTTGNVDISDLGKATKTKTPKMNPNYDISYDVPTLNNDIKWGRNKEATLRRLLSDNTLSVEHKENILRQYTENNPATQEQIREILANPNYTKETKDAVLKAANEKKPIPQIITGDLNVDKKLANIPGRVDVNTKVPEHLGVYDNLTKNTPNVVDTEKKIADLQTELAQSGKKAVVNTEPTQIDNVVKQEVEPTVNDVAKNAGGDYKVSQTRTNTLVKNGSMTDEQLAKYEPETRSLYKVLHNDESVENAIKMIENEGADNVVSRLADKSQFTATDTDALMSIWQSTIDKAQEMEASGQDASELWKKASDIFASVRKSGTKNAQAVQALDKWGRRTPAGMLSYAERLANGKIGKDGNGIVDGAEKFLDKFSKRKTGDIEFSPEFEKEFLDLATRYSKAVPESREANELFGQMGKLVNSQIPTSVPEAVKTILMNNMLGNFKTLISRNFLGNTGFAALEQIKKAPSSVIDKGLSKVTGRRTVANISKESLETYFNGMKKGLADEVADFKSGIRTGRSSENTIDNLKDAIANNRHVFNPDSAKNPLSRGLLKVADTYDKLVKTGLSVGDRPFYEATYAQTLEEYHQLGKDNILGDMANDLTDEEFNQFCEIAARTNALAAVYQDDSLIAQGLLSAKDGVAKISKGIVGYDILSQFSMPFVKTPANIVARAVEYSPLGFVKNAVNTASDIKGAGGLKNISADAQRRIADETSRNILGTAMFGVGAGLRNSDKISGAYSENDTEKALQKRDKYQEYAANLYKDKNGNTKQMDISWIPVVGTGIIAGAAAADAAKNPNNTTTQNISAGLKAGTNSMLGQSVFQGLQQLFGQGDSYVKSDGLYGNMKDVLQNGAGQLTNSFVRQIANTIDPYERDYSGGTFDYSLKSGVPVLREQWLEPKVNSKGEDVLANQGRNIGLRALENMILPGKITDYNPDELTKESDRLRDNVEENKYEHYLNDYTRRDIDKLVNGTNANGKGISNEEAHDYKQELTSGAKNIQEEILKSDVYKNADDVTKASLLSKAESINKQMFKVNHNVAYTPQNKQEVEALSKGTKEYIDLVTDKITAEKLGISYDDYKKKQSEGLSETDIQEYADNKKVLKDVMEGQSSTSTATAIEQLNNTELSDEQKGAALMTKGTQSEAMVSLQGNYGNAAPYYAKSAQMEYDSIEGSGKTGEKQQKAFNYIDSLNISDEEKGAIMAATFATSKQYQKSQKQFGDIGPYLLFTYKNQADTHKNKDKEVGKDGRISKTEAETFIENNRLDYNTWFPMLYSSYKEKK